MSKKVNAPKADKKTAKKVEPVNANANAAVEPTETPEAKKARIKAEKEEAKLQKAKDKEDAKAAKKAQKAAEKANKPPGVIASILIAIKESENPISQEQILNELSKAHDRPQTSMAKTIQAQLGGKKQPTRMEQEKNVTFEITFETKEEEDKEGNVTNVETKNKLFRFVSDNNKVKS